MKKIYIWISVVVAAILLASVAFAIAYPSYLKGRFIGTWEVYEEPPEESFLVLDEGIPNPFESPTYIFHINNSLEIEIEYMGETQNFFYPYQVTSSHFIITVEGEDFAIRYIFVSSTMMTWIFEENTMTLIKVG